MFRLIGIKNIFWVGNVKIIFKKLNLFYSFYFYLYVDYIKKGKVKMILKIFLKL